MTNKPDAERSLEIRDAVGVAIRSSLLDLGVPTVLVLVLHHRIGSPSALAVAGAWPALRFILLALRKRTVEPLAGLATLAFFAAILVYFAAGRDNLALELHEAVLTGILGIASLGAVIARAPMDGIIRRLAPAARLPEHASPAQQRRMRGGVAITGATCIVHCVATVVLALTASVSRFTVLSKLIGLPILGAGLLILLVYLRPRPTPNPAT